jgi:hypothetical protein
MKINKRNWITLLGLICGNFTNLQNAGANANCDKMVEAEILNPVVLVHANSPQKDQNGQVVISRSILWIESNNVKLTFFKTQGLSCVPDQSTVRQITSTYFIGISLVADSAAKAQTRLQEIRTSAWKTCEKMALLAQILRKKLLIQLRDLAQHEKNGITSTFPVLYSNSNTLENNSIDWGASKEFLCSIRD